jgi:hypothetical protein
MVQRSELGRTMGHERLLQNLEVAVERYEAMGA